MTQFIIPVGVARTVCASEWYANNMSSDPGTAVGIVARYFAEATQGGWARKMPQFSAEVLQAMIDAVAEVRSEDGLKMTEAGALDKFFVELRRRLHQRQVVEQQEAEERAARQVKDEAHYRAYATKRRERPLSPLVEAQRFTELKQIREDYGVDNPNPSRTQIWAALVTAFRAGATSFNRSSVELLAYEMPTYDHEKWDRRFANDKANFERAREHAQQDNGPRLRRVSDHDLRQVAALLHERHPDSTPSGGADELLEFMQVLEEFGFTVAKPVIEPKVVAVSAKTSKK